MKRTIFLVLIAVTVISHGCSDVSPDAINLEIDFSWEGMVACSWGIPEIGIKGVPENTKYLVVSGCTPEFHKILKSYFNQGIKLKPHFFRKKGGPFVYCPNKYIIKSMYSKDSIQARNPHSAQNEDFRLPNL